MGIQALVLLMAPEAHIKFGLTTIAGGLPALLHPELARSLVVLSVITSVISPGRVHVKSRRKSREKSRRKSRSRNEISMESPLTCSPY